MVANDTKVYSNNIAVRDAIANGEIDIGLINHYYVAEAVAEEGPDYPVGVFFPPNQDLGSLINVSGAAILASSKRKADGAEAHRLPALQERPGVLRRRDEGVPARRRRPARPGARAVREDPGARRRPVSDLAGLQETVKLLQETGAL